MKARIKLVGCASIASAIVSVYACGNSPSNPDGGNPDAAEATTTDALVPIDAAGDGEAGGDASTVVAVNNCKTALRIDSLAGVAGGGDPDLVAEAAGDKYVVMWSQLASVSPDSQKHIKARAFDGTALATELDLGHYTVDVKRLASDGVGHAFASWSGPTSALRAVFDFSALTFDTPVAFGVGASLSSMDVANAGAGLGLSIYFQSNGMLGADKWDTTNGWVTTGLALTASPNDLRSYSNKGKVVASWYAIPSFYALTYSGTWSTATSTTETDGGPPAYDQYTVLSNGDAIYMFLQTGAVQTAYFHAGTGTFDAPVTVETMPNVAQDGHGRHLMVADSADYVTIAWVRTVGNLSHTFASRSFDQGAHWSTPVDFGPSNFVSLGVGPQDDVVAATYGNGSNSGNGLGDAGIFLQAISPMGSTWSTPVQTNVETNQGGNYGSLSSSARILFDTKSHVILVGVQVDTDAGVGYTIHAVTCDL